MPPSLSLYTRRAAAAAAAGGSIWWVHWQRLQLVRVSKVSKQRQKKSPHLRPKQRSGGGYASVADGGEHATLHANRI